MTDEMTKHPRARRWGRTAAVVALTAAVAVPVTAYASNTFTDVPDSNVFHDDIQWMSDNGVTAGCNPPANDKYCPSATVTREQMAAFMHRLESKGVFLPADGKAADADKLDGREGTYYASPVAFAAGSLLKGTNGNITGDGEVARLTIEAPATGDIILRHTSSWDDNGSDYLTTAWIEPYNAGSPCDTFLDGDPVVGTFGETAVNGDAVAAGVGATMSGAGAVQGVSAGKHRYSFCSLTTGGSADNVDWSASAEWRASGATSVSAFDKDAREERPTGVAGTD